jgi:hypothetical protein
LRRLRSGACVPWELLPIEIHLPSLPTVDPIWPEFRHRCRS